MGSVTDMRPVSGSTGYSIGGSASEVMNERGAYRYHVM